MDVDGDFCRYGFLYIPSGNCQSPDSRNLSAVPKENGTVVRHSSVPRAASRKLLTKSKDDILNQPRKVDVNKTTAKELERTKKWRDMAVIDRPNGTIHYRFPISKKVSSARIYL